MMHAAVERRERLFVNQNLKKIRGVGVSIRLLVRMVRYHRLFMLFAACCSARCTYAHLVWFSGWH